MANLLRKILIWVAAIAGVVSALQLGRTTKTQEPTLILAEKGEPGV